MKTAKRITACVLAVLMVIGCCVFATVATDYTKDYPELLITEIGVDQYGDSVNANNKNKAYVNEMAERDPYEFIEIVNNSDKTVNVYDYMLAYQGAKSSNKDYFEKSIQEYTPFYPGADWTDGPFTSYDSYWNNTSAKRPVNPEYDGGKIAPGEVFVAWIYNADSHIIHATVDEFRSFWNVDTNVKVFLLDGFDSINKQNFSLKNSTTGTYAIIHSSERFLKRRSSDTAYDVEKTNTHHNYEDKNYEKLEEVISWAVVDYLSAPLSTTVTTNEKSNFTVSFIPYKSGIAAQNGYTSASYATLKRVHIDKVNSYAEATVGKLNAAQTEALKSTKTTVVRTTSEGNNVLINETKNRPSLIITEISADNRVNASNTNTEWTNKDSDPYECFEVYNNSAGVINIYDYMIGYQGSAATNVSTYFERLVQEYTPIFPGADWIDAPFGSYDKYWTNTSVKRPVNPAYNEGTLKAGEVAVVWAYSKDSHNIHATVEQFRKFWSIPDDVKVFILDANSSDRDLNFNIKNSDTGTYVIIKPCDKYPQRRGDDSTFDTEGGDRLSVYYDLHAGRSYETEPEIISWAVISFNLFDPLYTFYNQNGQGTATNNYTLEYAPYNGEKVYGNGFYTISFASQKRMHLQKAVTTATIGKLSPEQKTLIEKALKIS